MVKYQKAELIDPTDNLVESPPVWSRWAWVVGCDVRFDVSAQPNSAQPNGLVSAHENGCK